MNLLVGFYREPNTERAAEYLECLRRNACNDRIGMIFVFIEDDSTPAQLHERDPVFARSKVRLVPHRQRLTYSFLFSYANTHLPGSTVILANADIFFDETLALVEDASLERRLLCLSRWDESLNGKPVHYDQPNSQDAWIFEAPAPHIDCAFELGLPGCDNRLAYEAHKAGLNVSNPSRSLRARHLHRSQVRNYTQSQRLSGPVLLLPCCFFDDAQSLPGTFRPAAAEFPSHRGRQLDELVASRAGELELLIKDKLGIAAPRALRRELRAATARCTSLARPDVGFAALEFHEPMGYTLERMKHGISTHNNDTRPLVVVPPELEGLTFTQVVANHSAPVSMQFRTAGKVYVLAAPGWEGYGPAAAFLDDAGWREPIQALRTQDGTVFEVWSLVGTRGARLTAPTQVMLAARDLVRLEV